MKVKIPRAFLSEPTSRATLTCQVTCRPGEGAQAQGVRLAVKINIGRQNFTTEADSAVRIIEVFPPEPEGDLIKVGHGFASLRAAASRSMP